MYNTTYVVFQWICIWCSWSFHVYMHWFICRVHFTPVIQFFCSKHWHSIRVNSSNHYHPKIIQTVHFYHLHTIFNRHSIFVILYSIFALLVLPVLDSFYPTQLCISVLIFFSIHLYCLFFYLSTVFRLYSQNIRLPVFVSNSYTVTVFRHLWQFNVTSYTLHQMHFKISLCFLLSPTYHYI